MKPNIGRLDAYCRISLGLTMLACSTAKFVRKPNGSMPLVGAMIGGMKVAEGVTRFCPLVSLAEQQFDQFQDKEEYDHEIQQAVNPS